MYDVTTPPKGRQMGQVLVESFESRKAAEAWVRTDPKPLQGLTRVQVRDDRDWLTPVKTFTRSERGTWVVAK